MCNETQHCSFLWAYYVNLIFLTEVKIKIIEKN